MKNIKENEFDGMINISSNIRDNKNTIIGKFDLRDILFILIAGATGILILSIVLVALSIRNIFIIFIILSFFEIPIVTLGFFRIYNMKIIDYIKLKLKSDNKQYRKQIRSIKNNESEKYIFVLCIRDVDLIKFDKIINDLYKLVHFKNIELKILFKNLYLIIEVENLKDVLYERLFDYLYKNTNIKYVKSEDILNYELYINSLKFINKKYNKEEVKNIKKYRQKINKLKNIKEENKKTEYLANRILTFKNHEYIKVYKFVFYKFPFNLKVFFDLKDICNITSHICIENDNKEQGSINLSEMSFVNTFIDFTYVYEDISNKLIEEIEVKIKQVLDSYHILYKEIDEEEVKDSILFLMENRY